MPQYLLGREGKGKSPKMSVSQTYLRFADLVALGIVNNRVTLSRWQREQAFPKPVPLGPNTRVWLKEEIDGWLAVRAAARTEPPANCNSESDAA